MNRQLTHIIATQPLDRTIQCFLDSTIKSGNDDYIDLIIGFFININKDFNIIL